MSRRRSAALIGLLALCIVAVGGSMALQPQLRQASTLFAKYKCSEAVLAGRDERVIDTVDLPHLSAAARLWDTCIDEARRIVTSSLLGMAPSQAQYRDGLWRNMTPDGSPRLPGYPADAQYFSGYLGQLVIAAPRTDTVIVRLGFTRGGSTALKTFLARLYRSVPVGAG